MNSKKRAFMQEFPTGENRFFSCKKEDCSGAMCVGCNKHITKDEIGEQECLLKLVDRLYSEVLDTLGQSSASSCPNCMFSEMKDHEKHVRGALRYGATAVGRH
jgi:hypothetical protein